MWCTGRGWGEETKGKGQKGEGTEGGREREEVRNRKVSVLYTEILGPTINKLPTPKCTPALYDWGVGVGGTSRDEEPNKNKRPGEEELSMQM